LKLLYQGVPVHDRDFFLSATKFIKTGVEKVISPFGNCRYLISRRLSVYSHGVAKKSKATCGHTGNAINRFPACQTYNGSDAPTQNCTPATGQERIARLYDLEFEDMEIDVLQSTVLLKNIKLDKNPQALNQLRSTGEALLIISRLSFHNCSLKASTWMM
jgi:hypothetical protein